MFRLAFITDEATQDLDEAITLAHKQDVQGLELRSIDDTPIDELPEETLREMAKKIHDAGLAVPSIAGSFYKVVLRDEDVIKEEIEKLKRLICVAELFDAPLIRGFAGIQDKDKPQDDAELRHYLEEIEPLLADANRVLALEADPHVNTSNHKRLGELLDGLNPKYFKAIYDPGNSLYDPLHETPYPDGYEAIQTRLAHVHVKDVIYDEEGQPECVKIGTGLVPFTDIFRRLKEDRYPGWLSLETHYRKKVVLTQEQMLHPSGDTFSRGGKEAMEESLEATKAMLRQL